MATPKLGRATKFAFGLGAIAPGITTGAFEFFLLIFYSQVVGLDARLVGLAILIALIFDAISDPIVGYWSDNFRSRWGRRHPMMYASALPVAVSFYFLWSPPENASQTTLFWYLLTLAVIVRTAITFYRTPSSALTPDLVEDYDARTSLLSLRYFLGWVGGNAVGVWMFFIVFPSSKTAAIVDGRFNPEAYALYGLVGAIVILASIIIGTAGTHSRIPYLKPAPPRRRMTPKVVFGDLFETLSNRSFVALFLAAMLAVTAFPVMARILQEKGLTTSAMGAVGVAAAAVVTVGMFILLAVAKGVAAENTLGEHLHVFVGTAAYLAVMFGPVRIALRPMGERVRAAGAVSSTHFAVIFIVMFASAYAADRIGINVIVGGFVAGAVMPTRAVIFDQMNARLGEVTGTILLPIFLAFSGLRTDFTTMGWSWLPGLVLFVVAGIVGKWGAGVVSARIGGLTWAEGNVIGVLMNCRGLLVLVVALAAADSGIITPQMQIGGVLMALVTTGMTGPLFDRFLPAAIASSDGHPQTAAPLDPGPSAAAPDGR